MSSFRFPFLLLAALLLAGCIQFDQRSQPTVFHDFAAPSAAQPARPGPAIFIPRAQVPAAIRRPDIVVKDAARVGQVEDLHRWSAPVDRLLTEALGRHVRARSGLPVSYTETDRSRLVLWLNVEGFSVDEFRFAEGLRRAAGLTLRYRIEKTDGTVLKEDEITNWTGLPAGGADAFVKAQSNNLAKAGADISTELVRLAADAKNLEP